MPFEAQGELKVRFPNDVRLGDSLLQAFAAASRAITGWQAQIENSEWFASGDFATSRPLATDLGETEWSQFTIIAMERGIDIVARGSVTATWHRTQNA